MFSPKFVVRKYFELQSSKNNKMWRAVDKHRELMKTDRDYRLIQYALMDMSPVRRWWMILEIKWWVFRARYLKGFEKWFHDWVM